jgi:hypothetical protein
MDVTEPPHVVGSMDKMRAAEIFRRNDFHHMPKAPSLIRYD